jgi:peptide deformylase
MELHTMPINYQLVKDKSLLKTKSENVTPEEGEKIANHLYEVINDLNVKFNSQYRVFSLAAPQIGIFKNVFVLNLPTKGHKTFINPIITEHSPARAVYVESYPNFLGKNYKTVRSMSLKISSDNFTHILEFSPDDKNKLSNENYFHDEGLLECVLIQNCVDLLNGVLAYDSSRKYIEPKKSKIERNKKVMIQNLITKETKFEKYKKLEQFLSTNEWQII